MTLAYLEGVQTQLELQYKQLLDAPPANDKPVIKYTNAIEILAAISLCKQLIIKEKIEVMQPPGSTGPVL